jgi:23S rRNA (uracil1939-C5)-methyltransferase
MFCGLGNFTLPLATQCHEVVGVEGSASLTERGEQAAVQAGIFNAKFQTLNLFEVDQVWLQSLGRVDKMLIDPPREGAFALVQALAALPQQERPVRIVYVSCNPATLARDADVLVNQAGYHLHSAGAINMFPHTSHIESIAVFERKD